MLIKKLKPVNILDNHVLISFDVKSLFTNVPLDLVKTSIRKRFKEIKTVHKKFLLRDILEAIDLIYNTLFSCNGLFYKQIFGTPMGSPISPILADIVMADLDIKCLKKLNFVPLFYFRYVDDLLLCIPEDKIDYT